MKFRDGSFRQSRRFFLNASIGYPAVSRKYQWNCNFSWVRFVGIVVPRTLFVITSASLVRFLTAHRSLTVRNKC